ncbi:MAG: sugar porter family MFS transporter [Chthoniobacterales bacterium]|nr:sugar porter family MFS transporter [Chthoniobacterales bacterium]
MEPAARGQIWQRLRPGPVTLQPIQPPMNSSSNTPHPVYGFLVALVAALGAFIFGYDLSLMAGANTIMRQQFNLSEAEFAFATSSGVLGCVAGPFLGAWLCDRFGRKKSLIFASLLLAVNAIFTALAPNMWVFNFFRILGGVGCGICSVASPMYIAEISSPKSRGAMGLMYQVAVVIGALSAGLACYFLALLLPDSVSWRWMFFSQMVAIVCFVGLLFPMPESPRWLAEEGRDEEAGAVLARIGGEDFARQEMTGIRASLQQEEGGWREFWAPGMRSALLVGLLLAFFNNFTGWSGIAMYLPTLFKIGGFPDTADAIMQFVVAYAFMGAVTIGSMFVVDRWGRRPLWNVASVGMCVAMFLAGLVFQYHIKGYAVLAVVMLCAIPHALALGGLPWLMIPEIYPTRIRAKAVSAIVTFLWLTIFLASTIFPLMMSWSRSLVGTEAAAFWVFSGISLLSLLFGKTLLPETRGRTLEEIGDNWLRRGH